MTEIERLLKLGIKFTPVVVCFLVKGEKVLLGLRKKVSLGLGENVVSGIGGKVGDKIEFKDESVEEAVIREIQEEIGVVATKFRNVGRVRFIYPDKPKWQQDALVYIVDDWEEEPQESEAMRPEWFEISNLPISRMWEDNSHWVPKILRGEIVNVTFLLNRDSKVIEYVFE